jgi:Flp pilus assembly protein TadD
MQSDTAFVRKRLSLTSVACLIVGLNAPGLALGRSTGGWQGKQTSHFAIYTPEEVNGGGEILARLEVARLFFEKIGLTKNPAAPRLSILDLGSRKDYGVYRLNPAAWAFYQRTREGDFVAMRDLAPEHYPVAIHEYTHFVMEHAGLKLPLWLNEGLADFYSTVEARKTQVSLGTAPDGRLDFLNRYRWLDWATLAAVDHDSPYYREADKMQLFYAQSWALVHMLALDAEYEGGFERFVLAVSGGAATDAALTAVYHKSLEQIGQDLRGYLGSKRMTVRVFNIDVRQALLETEEIADAGKRVEFALAEILASSPQLAQDANSHLAELAARYQDDPHPEESLGFQAMRDGMPKDAESHFARAVQRHSQDPEVWFRLAHLKLQAEGPTAEVLDLLERVIAVDGGHYAARLELGFAAAKNDKYELAVKTLEGISKVKPEHAYVVSYTLAYFLVEIGQGHRARQYAEQARKMAGNNKDQTDVAGLLRYIGQDDALEAASR